MAHAAGRPSTYNAKFHTKLVEALARNGLTDKEIAYKLDIAEATLNNWKIKHQEFLESIRKGREEPDAQVEQALFKRALGYDYIEAVKKAPRYTKEELDRGADPNEMIVSQAIKKHVAPDVAACIIWLKNRRPDKWRDRIETKIIPEDETPLDSLTYEERKRIALEWAAKSTKKPT